MVSARRFVVRHALLTFFLHSCLLFFFLPWMRSVIFRASSLSKRRSSPEGKSEGKIIRGKSRHVRSDAPPFSCLWSWGWLLFESENLACRIEKRQMTCLPIRRGSGRGSGKEILHIFSDIYFPATWRKKILAFKLLNISIDLVYSKEFYQLFFPLLTFY